MKSYVFSNLDILIFLPTLSTTGNAIKFTPIGGHIQVRATWVRCADDDDIVGDDDDCTVSSKSKNKKWPTKRDGKSKSKCNRRLLLPSCDLSDRSDIEPSGFIKIEVSDTGEGLSSDQLTKLFRAGTQFNANKLQGGG